MLQSGGVIATRKNIIHNHEIILYLNKKSLRLTDGTSTENVSLNVGVDDQDLLVHRRFPSKQTEKFTPKIRPNKTIHDEISRRIYH